MNNKLQKNKYVYIGLFLIIVTLCCFFTILSLSLPMYSESKMVKYSVLLITLVILISCTFIVNVRIKKFYLLIFLFPLFVLVIGYYSNEISIVDFIILASICLICIGKIYFFPAK